MTLPIDLSVVLPSYLEEENLRILLPRLKESLLALGCSFEIVVVDSLKPLDHTEKVCKEVDVRFVRRRGGEAFGDAVRTGIEEARGARVIFMDADGSHPPEFIQKLYECRDQADVVIASRYADGGLTENSAILVWMSKALNYSYSLVLGLRCRDVSNSFKLYRTSQLKALRLKCQNFDIVEEILFKLHRQFKVSILEVPFTFKKRMFGESKRNLFWFVLTYLYTLIRLRLS